MLLEKAKSATLVILFAICAYLAGQLLLDSSSISARTGSGTTQVSVNIEDLLNPQGYQVSFGGGLYSGYFDYGLKQRLWTTAKGLLRPALETANYTEVNQAMWDQAVTQRSVYLRMPFAMTADQLLAVSGSAMSRELLGSAVFDVIVLPTTEQSGVYLGNRSEGRYLRFDSGADNRALGAVVSDIEKDTMTIEYKRIEDTFSLRTILEKPGQLYRENHIIEPIVTMPPFERVRVSHEFNLQALSEEQERYYANIAFGARFDFVKRVREVDGSIVYLYGYGDRALRFGSQGKLEYIQRFQGAGSTGEGVGFRESLTKAASELRKYGPLPEDLYLSAYTEMDHPSGAKVRTFYFTYAYEHIPVKLTDHQSAYSAAVEMTGSQVTYLSKNYKQVIRALPDQEPGLPVLSMDQLIEQQFNLIQSDYLQMHPEAVASKDTLNFVYQILHDIAEYDLVYVMIKENGVYAYTPAWHLGIGTLHYYFDLYTGELLYREPLQGVK